MSTNFKKFLLFGTLYITAMAITIGLHYTYDYVQACQLLEKALNKD